MKTQVVKFLILEKIITYLKLIFYLANALFFALPLGLIWPKKKNSGVVIGRDNSIFTDSTKYFYLYVINEINSDLELTFITKDKPTYKKLKKLNYPVLFHPTKESILTLLRSSLVIIDNWMWINSLCYHLLIKAKKIQIWHGIPLKKIQLNNPKNLKKLDKFRFKIYSNFIGLYPKYDLIISTSEYFTKNAFIKAFKSKDFLESGYPRNDVLYSFGDCECFLNTDTDVIKKITLMKDNNYKIIVYAPTFRDSGGDVLSTGSLDLKTLSEFSKEKNIVFVLKFHPDPVFLEDTNTNEEIHNIFFYKNSCDLYPLLPLTDCLITDYSSIYFDYLHLNKPIIYFPFDYEKYIREDRELIFEYEEMTPGPKCYDQDTLQRAIYETLLEGKDEYKEERRKLLDKSFKYKDGKSSERIYEYIKDNFLEL